MLKCLAAWTPPGGALPEFINATLHDDGTVRVIVRAPSADGMTAPCAYIDMTREQWRTFIGDALVAEGQP